MENNLTRQKKINQSNIETIDAAFLDYIESLNPLQYKALQISIRELESSFSLEKSIGYINSLNSINHKNT